QAELVRKEAVAQAGPVLAGAADAGAGVERAILPHRNRVATQRVTVSDGFVGDVLHHAVADEVVQLIHGAGIIGKLAGWPALQHDYRERRSGGDLLRHRQADPAAARNHDVYWLEALHVHSVRRAGSDQYRRIGLLSNPLLDPGVP